MDYTLQKRRTLRKKDCTSQRPNRTWNSEIWSVKSKLFPISLFGKSHLGGFDYRPPQWKPLSKMLRGICNFEFGTGNHWYSTNHHFKYRRGRTAFLSYHQSRKRHGRWLGSCLWAKVYIEGLPFVQFHPTALYPKINGNTFLISAVRGEGAILNISGKRFMTEYHHLAELAPRDIVARSIAEVVNETGDDYVLLNCQAIGERIWKSVPHHKRELSKNGN